MMTSVDFIASETVIRIVFFVALFAGMAIWEVLSPRRLQGVGRSGRWPGNLAVTVINAVLLRMVFPVTAVGLAASVETGGVGLLNVAGGPFWLRIAAAVVVLDLAIYLQHVLFHAVPALWRLHRMHHADLAFDVTTGTLFHPIEMILSMVLKFMVIAAFGAPAAAVLIFEVLLNGTSMFNHGNVGLPLRFDRVIRWLVVTPDMHRVHHSIERHETNSKFGFNLSCWDRLFGTYRAQPGAGHEGMTIGIETFRTPDELRLGRMLAQPFKGPVGVYPIGRRRRK